MAESLRLEFTCTREERSAAERLARRQSTKWWLRVLMILALGAMGWQVVQLAPEERIVWLATFAVVWFVVFFVLRRLNGRPEPNQVWLLPGIVRVITPKLDRQFEPGELAPLLESEELFVLRNRGGSIMIPVPKRVFPDADAQAQFRTLLVGEPAKA